MESAYIWVTELQVSGCDKGLWVIEGFTEYRDGELVPVE